MLTPFDLFDLFDIYHCHVIIPFSPEYINKHNPKLAENDVIFRYHVTGI